MSLPALAAERGGRDQGSGPYRVRYRRDRFEYIRDRFEYIRDRFEYIRDRFERKLTAFL
jgi:hypothetical protein